MPLTDKGASIKKAMQKEYGSKKGEEVFYASKNKGTISGVDSQIISPKSDSFRRDAGSQAFNDHLELHRRMQRGK